ncbi:gamma carbonic anhydrase family protein [Pendulispora albinea]|uniref:Gamma carbonic anhydrase family protein n=1 Tax=Pendulispora albinea TaxID=2741071 RepID=A0ABZ2LIZ6_9BACT
MPLYEYDGERPILGPGVYVAPQATVIGKVHLAEAASVWFGAVLRGDVGVIRIGARTNVQDNAVIHVTGGLTDTTVGEDVTIGHLALLHGCTIGDRCLVGMGSIVLDNATIGDECFIGAGTLITPATVIPPRSFVLGRPGKVIRAVTETDLAWIVESGKHYAEYAKRFTTSLKLIEGT